MILWDDIPHQVPTGPGIYAWYAHVEISDFDIAEAFSQAEAALSRGDEREALQVIQNLLEASVYRVLGPGPYAATLTGDLKTPYAGTLHPQRAISDLYLRKLATNVDRLYQLKQMLLRAVPNFLPPLYIGLARDLRSRLRRHKHLIDRDTLPPLKHGAIEDSFDQSFAREVRDRRIPPPSLTAYVMQLPVGSDPHDLEYLLNRLTFPTFGKR